MSATAARAVPPPLLIDLLGARHELGAPVLGVAWAGDSAGFGLGDGSLALAASGWPGAPELRPRPTGNLELVPASAPPPEPRRHPMHRGACLSVVADPAPDLLSGGLLSGGDDGRLLRLDAAGAVSEIAAFDGGWADPVAAGRGGRRACAVGRHLHLFGPAPRRFEAAGRIVALAFDPSTLHLAIAHGAGVSVLTEGVAAPRMLEDQAGARALCWTDDGDRLAVALAGDGLWLWQVATGRRERLADGEAATALAFAGAGECLAAVCAGRLVCWTGTPPAAQALGPAAQVSRIAGHPRLALFAAGYANGAVLLCRPGLSDVLFVRGAGGGAVTALGFHPDGTRLAIGTDDGEAAIVMLPDGLFRFQAQMPPAARRTA